MWLTLILALTAAAAEVPRQVVVQGVQGQVRLATGTRAEVHQQQPVPPGERVVIEEGASMTVALLTSEPPSGLEQTWNGPVQLVATRDGLRGRSSQLATETQLDTMVALGLIGLHSAATRALSQPDALRGSEAALPEPTASEQAALDAASARMEAARTQPGNDIRPWVEYAGLLLALGNTEAACPVLREAASRCPACGEVAQLVSSCTAGN